METAPQGVPEVQETTVEEEINLYPTLRSTILNLCIVLTTLIILFLLYQNGKSIYDKGL
jgi:hypothetical protein